MGAPPALPPRPEASGAHTLQCRGAYVITAGTVSGTCSQVSTGRTSLPEGWLLERQCQDPGV